MSKRTKREGRPYDGSGIVPPYITERLSAEREADLDLTRTWDDKDGNPVSESVAQAAADALAALRRKLEQDMNQQGEDND